MLIYLQVLTVATTKIATKSASPLIIVIPLLISLTYRDKKGSGLPPP
ncbi:hypothetical protein PPBDW_I10125 [Photobacterium kishitanii]|nr:hypothetical protein PPBDW_I10125 [Photobacterium kishitanii]